MKFFKLKILGIVLLALVGIVFALPHKAQAANWDPGRIIDDGKFTNKNSMSIADIQAFLNSKVPVCDTWHVPGPSAQGANPPWYCLKEYVENGKSSSQIIWEAAQNYSINPQVLIVTLQKENGLVTDTWPYPWQYRTAMGFACPDNGSCDPAFYGFTNQVNQAARHFRNFYDNNPNWYVPFHLGNNYIQWSPNGSCGGSNVNIVTRGTAALYSYTPYQPNQAAINNLYGTGDGCSAYGNRNFWRDFNNWFGPTLDAPYNWQWTGQAAYSDAAHTQPIDIGALAPGQTVYLRVQGINTGNSTWQKNGTNPVRLGTWNPTDRNSSFASGWLSGNRPTGLVESSVTPGQTGTFDFPITVPSNTGPGSYREYFNPVAEGVSWFNDWGVYFDIGVKQGYKVSYAGQSAYPSIFPGQSQQGYISYKNEGASAWYDDTSLASAPSGTKPVHLATNNPVNRASQFGATWGGDKNRPSSNFSAVYEANGTTLAPSQHVVQPGQIAKFTFTFSASGNVGAGNYREFFIPVLEGVGTFNDVGTFLDVNVQTATYSDAYVNQSIYPTIAKGNSFTGFISYRNTGNVAWYDDTSLASAPSGTKPVHLATDAPINRTSQFGATWTPNKNRPGVNFGAVYESNGTTLAANQHVVQPGQIVKMNIPFTTSASTPTGTYTENFRLIVEGGSLMNNIGAFLIVTVSP